MMLPSPNLPTNNEKFEKRLVLSIKFIMDSLSAGVSIITVIQLTQSIANGLRTFYRHVRDARKEIDKLYSTIIGLEIVLKELGSLSQQLESDLLNSALWIDLKGPLNQANCELKKLKDLLEIDNANKTRLEQVKQSFQNSLKWPLKQDEISEIVQRLEGHKLTLVLQLSMNNFSAVIDQIQHTCHNEPNAVVAFWYFTFRNTATQTIDNLLRYLVMDLYSMQPGTPDAIEKAFEDSNNGLRLPSVKSLRIMLLSLLHGFENVYLFLDALDESLKSTRGDQACRRDELLELIHEIFSWEEESMHLLLTSTEEQDIKRILM
ncbi:hypothetical protein NHQ30_001061 [Ciborinia camelliae]|nr:hypothetical protein NHQ30_001061 [Ciborinia camelliae]